MRTPEEIIGTDAVLALKDEGYVIDEVEPPIPYRTHWVDSNGVSHPIEHHSVSHEQWRMINGARVRD